MEKIIKILNSITFPDPVYEMCLASNNYIRFQPTHEIQLPEAADELTKLVVSEIKRRYLLNTKFIDHEIIINNVVSTIRGFCVNLWMIVNKKTSWKRTKLSKDINYAKSDKFKTNIVELFIDAAKFGVIFDTLHISTEIKPIHKFIAMKFQAMVEAECPQ